MPGWINSFLAHFTYLALIAVLLAAGFGAPIPEDIPLATSGYLCHPEESPIKNLPMIDTNHDGIPDTARRIPNLYLMILSGMIGVMGGDAVVFYIGRKGIDSDNFIARHLRKVLHSKRRERVERHFHKHGSLTVFMGRFMPGFRSLVFAMAGMSKMSFGRFIIIDGFAALISVPTFVLLGYHFADRISFLFKNIEKVKHIVTPIAIGVLLIAGIIYYLRRHRRRMQAALVVAKDENLAPLPADTTPHEPVIR